MSEDQQPSQTQTPPPSNVPNDSSVTRYLSILFAAAFLLLLITFAMERREHQVFQEQSQEQISTLEKKSVSAVQSLQNLYDENEHLKQQLEELTQQLEQSQETAQALETQQTSQSDTLDQQGKSLEAMDWFWQVNEAYVLERYALCRTLIESMEEQDLIAALPSVSVTNNRRFSPSARLAEIQAAIA